VHKATKQLEGAKTLQKSTRKWMCCALIVFLIILIIVVLFVVKPWETNKKKLL
jgi:syntaxin 1B/2/3